MVTSICFHEHKHVMVAEAVGIVLASAAACAVSCDMLFRWLGAFLLLFSFFVFFNSSCSSMRICAFLFLHLAVVFLVSSSPLSP